jgi:hypothetical protein
MTTSSEDIDAFVAELHRDPAFAHYADQFAHALTALDREADKNVDATELFGGLMWARPTTKAAL